MNFSSTIGIDLGSSACCVSVFDKSKQQVLIISNEEGNRTTPAVVSFTPDSDDCLVGETAKLQLVRNAPNTILDLKRILSLYQTQDYKKLKQSLLDETQRQGWQFRVVSQLQQTSKSSNTCILFRVSKKKENQVEYTLQQLLAALLSKLKKTAEHYIGASVQQACISVPSNFTDEQQSLLLEAAQLAKLNIRTILLEPVAAAIAYGLDLKSNSHSYATPTTTPTSPSPLTPTDNNGNHDREKKPNQQRKVLVLDIGSSSCDTTILQIEDGIIEVKSRVSNRNIGGNEFDKRLIQFCIQEFYRRYKIDISSNTTALNTLKLACERAKIVLSNSQSATIDCESLCEGIDFSLSISRSKFDLLNMDLFQNASVNLIHFILYQAGIEQKNQVSDVILSGGGCSIQKIQHLVQEYFSPESCPNTTIHKSITPEELVATGNAIEAYTRDENADIPKQPFSIPILPLSVGTASDLSSNATFVPIISRNVPVPHSEAVTFTVSTTEKSFLPLFEGERIFIKDNRKLGYVIIPPSVSDKNQDQGAEGKQTLLFQLDINGRMKIMLLGSDGQQNALKLHKDASSSTLSNLEEVLKDSKSNRKKDEQFKLSLQSKQ